MRLLPRFAAAVFLVAVGQPVHAQLPEPVRAMIDAAINSGKDGDIETVAGLAKLTNPGDVAEIDVLLADYYVRRNEQRQKLAQANRTKLEQAQLWQNWKGEGQVGATHSSGNSSAAGINVGIALTRKGIDWNQRLRAQVDYQRTDGRTTLERYLVEYEPQVRVSDRAFAFGFGRWERDRILGLRARWSASGGLGYKVIDRDTLALNIKAGPAWQRSQFVDGQRADELTVLTGLDFRWQLTPTLRLTEVASTIVGTNNMTTKSLTSLNAKLTGALSARIAYSAEIDTNPPPGIEHIDTLTRFTLVYGF